MSNAVIECPALGRAFRPGCLYNACDEKLLQIDLWKQDDIANHLQTTFISQDKGEIVIGDKISDNSNLFKMDVSLKLSLMAGLLNVGGSAHVLNETTENSRVSRVNVIWSRQTVERSLTSDLIFDSSKIIQAAAQQEATHVVTSVKYGGSATITFEKITSDSSRTTEVGGSLSLAFRTAVPSFSIEGEGELEMTDADKKAISNATVSVCTDFKLDSNPTTFEEAAKLAGQLPQKFEQGENMIQRTDKDGNVITDEDGNVSMAVIGVPISVTLTPIEKIVDSTTLLMFSINDDILNQATEMMSDLNDAQKQMAELLDFCQDRPGCLYNLRGSFPRFEKELDQMKEAIVLYKNYISGKLKKLLPPIRAGGSSEQSMFDLIASYHTSCFAPRCIGPWIENYRSNIQVMDSYLKRLLTSDADTVTFCKEPSDLRLAMMNFPGDRSVFLMYEGVHDPVVSTVINFAQTALPETQDPSKLPPSYEEFLKGEKYQPVSVVPPIPVVTDDDPTISAATEKDPTLEEFLKVNGLDEFHDALTGYGLLKVSDLRIVATDGELMTELQTTVNTNKFMWKKFKMALDKLAPRSVVPKVKAAIKFPPAKRSSYEAYTLTQFPDRDARMSIIGTLAPKFTDFASANTTKKSEPKSTPSSGDDGDTSDVSASVTTTSSHTSTIHQNPLKAIFVDRLSFPHKKLEKGGSRIVGIKGGNILPKFVIPSPPATLTTTGTYISKADTFDIDLKWQAADGAISYELEINFVEKKQHTILHRTGGTKHRMSGLPIAAALHTARVRSVSAIGHSTWSDTLSIVPPAAAAAAAGATSESSPPQKGESFGGNYHIQLVGSRKEGSPPGPYLHVYENSKGNGKRDDGSTYACVHDKLYGERSEWRLIDIGDGKYHIQLVGTRKEGSPPGPYLHVYENSKGNGKRDDESTYACVHDKLYGARSEWRLKKK